MDRLGQELAALGVAMDRLSSTDILYLIQDGKIVTPDFPYDFVIVVDKDKYILKALQNAHIRLFNSASSVEVCDDKMLTHFALAEIGIPMPTTVGIPLNYVNGDATPFLKKAGQELGYPCIIKTNFGSMGSGVYLAHNEEELIALEKSLRPASTFLQQYVASSKGHDTRVICLGGKVIASYKRVSDSNDFRSNIALGGHGEKITLSPKGKEIAEKAAQHLGLDYCGLDLLDGPDGPLLCEVNSNAFFEEAEKVSVVNIANAYASYIVQSFK